MDQRPKIYNCEGRLSWRPPYASSALECSDELRSSLFSYRAPERRLCLLTSSTLRISRCFESAFWALFPLLSLCTVLFGPLYPSTTLDSSWTSSLCPCSVTCRATAGDFCSSPESSQRSAVNLRSRLLIDHLSVLWQ